MILSVSDPKWDSKIREWVLIYKVKDSTIGVYEQRITAEALISAERVRNMIVSEMQRGSK